MYSYLWCRKGLYISVKELHNFIDTFLVWLLFDQGDSFDGELGCDIVYSFWLARHRACLYARCSVYLI